MLAAESNIIYLSVIFEAVFMASKKNLTVSQLVLVLGLVLRTK